MHQLLELIKKEQNIYNVVFHELIRQVNSISIIVEYCRFVEALSTLESILETTVFNIAFSKFDHST